MTIQFRRTPVANRVPTGLAPGQLAVEMASNPARLWVGVPASVNADERLLLNPRLDPSETAHLATTGSPTFTGDPTAPNGQMSLLDTSMANCWFATNYAWAWSPNLSLNPAVDVWQRGPGPWVIPEGAGMVTADGWIVGCSANPNGATVERVEHGRVEGVSRYAIQINGAPGLTGVFVRQNIEGAVAVNLGGQFIYGATIQNATGGQIMPNWAYHSFNTPDSTVGETSQNLTGSAWTNPSWFRMARSWILPATIGGQPVNTRNGFGIRMTPSLGVAWGAGHILRITEMDIRPWSANIPTNQWAVPTAYTQPLPVELRRCYRYYYRPVEGGQLQMRSGSYLTRSGAPVDFYYRLPVPMRVAPTLGGCSMTGGNLNGGAVATTLGDNQTVHYSGTVAGSSVDNADIEFGFADAEII